jgi:translocation and assembly module TamB
MLERDELPDAPREDVEARSSVPPRASVPPRVSAPAPPRWDPIRFLAKVLCALLAVVGVVPIAAALLISSAPVQRWAEAETRRLLEAQLGVKAEYKVSVRLLPLRLAITNLEVPSSDGGPPALVTESVSASPRVFSLLSGRLDLGEITLEKPHVRVVIRDGKITNFEYKLPEPPAKSSGAKQTPFFSLAVTEGRFDVDIDGTHVQTGYVDLDVFAEENDVFELSLHSGKSTIRRERVELTKEIPRTGSKVYDEDVICRLEARIHADQKQILVRRFSLLGVADGDPERGDPPSCENVDANTRQLAVRISQLRVALEKEGPPSVFGHLMVRAPLDLTNRFVPTLPLKGWAAVSGDLRFDGKSRLPEFSGRVTGGGIEFERYKLARELEVDVKIEDEIIFVPSYRMLFADGDVRLKNARIEPFAPGAQLTVEQVDGKGMQFSGLMRDLGVTPDTIIWWNLEKTLVKKISGTLSPLKIDAELTADTKDFEVFDRAYHDRGRQHMIGVKHALVRGRIGVRPEAFQIYDTRTDFGNSSLYVAMVSIGFDNTIKLSVPKGGRLDLSDISPLVDIPMAGKAEVEVEMAGAGGDPTLTGALKVANFEFGGFPFGDIQSAKVRFKPLWLELTDVLAQKGRSAYKIPTAKLDFDTDASIKVDAEATSSAFDIRDFFAMWHFDQDPRWDDIKGETALDARVRYVFGGKEDVCQGGLLETQGKVTFHYAEIFEERYDGGEAEFDLRWFDREATYHGMELKIPSLTLRKGPGLLIGSIDVTRGAKIAGHLVATSVPINKIDAVPLLLRGADARASAEAEISGSLDLLRVDAKARLSPVQLGRATLPASEFRVELDPVAVNRPVLRTTKCGGPVTPPFDKSEYAADRSSGLFVVNGKLFGGRVGLSNLSITRQRNKIVRGTVLLDDFDIGALGELSSTIALSESRVEGPVTGKIEIEELPMARPSSSELEIELERLRLSRAGYTVELLPSSQPIEMADGKLRVGGLGLDLVTPRGQRVGFDFSGAVHHLDGSPVLDATLALRPMALASLVGVVPRVERASGVLGGRLRLEGPLVSPRASGAFELSRGEMTVRDRRGRRDRERGAYDPARLGEARQRHPDLERRRAATRLQRGRRALEARRARPGAPHGRGDSSGRRR